MTIAFRTSTTGDAVEQAERIDLTQAMWQGLRDALGGWATAKRGLAARLAPDAMERFGFTARSPGYVARVRRSWGKYMPFVSPRRSGYGSVGKFLWSLTKPGVGHNLYDGSRSGTRAEVILAVPAARGLNFKAANGVYLDEWCRRYPHEDAEIEVRMAEAIEARIDQAIAKGTA